MEDINRRSFLVHEAAMLAATTAVRMGLVAFIHTPSPSPLLTSPGLLTQPFVGIQMSPHTMLYEGIGPCLDLIQEKVGVNAVFSYSHAFHADTLGKPARELAADHGKPPRDFRGKVPAVWVTHHAEFFKYTMLKVKPTDPSQEFANRELFKEIVEPARSRNIKVFARILESLGKQIENFDLVRTVDVYGKRGNKACWSHEGVKPE